MGSCGSLGLTQTLLPMSKKNGQVMVPLELQEDIYCITFIKLLKQKGEHEMLRVLYQKCCIAFFFQMSLVFFVAQENRGEPHFRGDYKINCTRVICSYLLHLLIMPEVRCALDMMKYTKNNASSFADKTNNQIAFSVAYMKIFGGLFTEIVNIGIIITSTTVTDIVKDFIALGIISEIDDYVGKSLKHVNMEQEIDQAKIEYPESQNVETNE